MPTGQLHLRHRPGHPRPLSGDGGPSWLNLHRQNCRTAGGGRRSERTSWRRDQSGANARTLVAYGNIAAASGDKPLLCREEGRIGSLPEGLDYL